MVFRNRETILRNTGNLSQHIDSGSAAIGEWATETDRPTQIQSICYREKYESA